jgi:hypothetical protein
MRPVIQLNHRHYAETRRITQNKINVFASDAVEGRLPTAPARTADRAHNICQPNLDENMVIGSDRLLKNSEERTLCRCKQSGSSLICRGDGLRRRLPTEQPKQRRGNHEKREKNCREN